VQWTVRYALTALIGATVVSSAVALLLGALGVHPGPAGTLVEDAVLIASLGPLACSRVLRPIDLGLRPVSGARSVGLVVLAWFAYVLGSRIWVSAVHPPSTRTSFAGISHHSTLVIALTGLAAVVTAPVVEEVFFRGLLYRSLRNRLAAAPASVLAAGLFAIGHTQYPLLVRPEIAWFGVIAAVLYEHTGSLLPAIALHCFIDGGDFETSLTRNDSVVLSCFLVLATVLLVRSRLEERRAIPGEGPRKHSRAAPKGR
jgi:membrane protease YdiL (CAAX protease family)